MATGLLCAFLLALSAKLTNNIVCLVILMALGDEPKHVNMANSH